MWSSCLKFDNGTLPFVIHFLIFPKTKHFSQKTNEKKIRKLLLTKTTRWKTHKVVCSHLFVCMHVFINLNNFFPVIFGFSFAILRNINLHIVLIMNWFFRCGTNFLDWMNGGVDRAGSRNVVAEYKTHLLIKI